MSVSTSRPSGQRKGRPQSESFAIAMNTWAARFSARHQHSLEENVNGVADDRS